jgi:ABC-type xylose transport system permease subunit
LEVIAGISTYFLARRLSLPVFFATVAGMLFALNGTFAWLGNAVLNPSRLFADADTRHRDDL